MTVIIGRKTFFSKKRGKCLDDGTCRCDPFYFGKSCGDIIKCPNGLSQTICDQVRGHNFIESSVLVDDGNSNGNDSNVDIYFFCMMIELFFIFFIM